MSLLPGSFVDKLKPAYLCLVSGASGAAEMSSQHWAAQAAGEDAGARADPFQSHVKWAGESLAYSWVEV